MAKKKMTVEEKMKIAGEAAMRGMYTLLLVVDNGRLYIIELFKGDDDASDTTTTTDPPPEK